MTRPTRRLLTSLMTLSLSLAGCQPTEEAALSASISAAQGGKLLVQRTDHAALAGTALSVAAGSLGKDTQVSVMAGTGGLTEDGDRSAGPVVRWEPRGLSFSKTAVVTLPYVLGEGQRAEDLVIVVEQEDGRRRVIPRRELEVLTSAGVVRFRSGSLGSMQPSTDDDHSTGDTLEGTCQSDADCGGGLHCSSHVCRVDDDPHGDDATPGSQTCTSDNECALGYECEHGACAPHGTDDGGEAPTGGVRSCGTDAQCGAGYECEHGACAPHGGDDDGGTGGGTGGTACTNDAQCGAGLECEHGACAPHGGGDDGTADSCTSDSQCATGQTCHDGVCEVHG